MNCHDLVVFGEDWGAHPSSTQHLFKRLKRDRRTLWINSIGLRRPRLCLSDLNRLVAKGRSLLRAAPAKNNNHQEDSPEILHPAAIPLPGNPLAKLLNRHLVGKKIVDRCENLGIQRPILWTSLPTAVDLVGSLNERAVVYYCGDDFNALAGVDHQVVTQLEEKLAKRADLIFAASPALMKKFPEHKTHLLPHGVDVELFETPVPRAKDLPQGKPIAGFYGSISEWIDTELIVATAKQMPQWNFCFIGQVHTDISCFKGIKNIKLLGPRNHDQLPSYAQHWQASLLPFRDSPQIRSCNPLKLREYLAIGRPIISTDFPALNGYRDLLSVVSSADQLTTALTQAQEEDPWVRAFRQHRVRQESWKVRGKQVAALLEELN